MAPHTVEVQIGRESGNLLRHVRLPAVEAKQQRGRVSQASVLLTDSLKYEPIDQMMGVAGLPVRCSKSSLCISIAPCDMPRSIAARSDAIGAGTPDAIARD